MLWEEYYFEAPFDFIIVFLDRRVLALVHFDKFANFSLPK